MVHVLDEAATVVELGGRIGRGTNNQAELDGAIAGFTRIAGMPGPATLYSDSQYLLNGASKWCRGWVRNGWRKRDGDAVLNADRWRTLYELVLARKPLGPLAWEYLKGHAGIPANERADAIACAFADARTPALYAGPLAGYEVPIFDLPDAVGIPERARSVDGSAPVRGAKEKPLCYLSLVGGALERHADWAACEARVKGQRGAKFKKAMSAEDERAILRQWGLDG